MAATDPMLVFDGDTLLFYCPEASGYIYTEPVSYESDFVTVFPSEENSFLQFPNIDFAAFHITHGRLPDTSYKHRSLSNKAVKNTAEPMTIVYGSTVKLQHRASSKYLAVNPKNYSVGLGKGDSEASLFRLVPPQQEKGFSDDLAINDSVTLESIHHKKYRIKCFNNSIESSYHLVLSVTGSIFSVKPHCYTMNSQCIKGGSVIMLSSLKIDGYISVKGSFVNDKLPEEFKQSHSEVGLRKWRQGFFKVLPYSGDTFFQLEKTTQLLTGSPFSFGEQCRIKHMPTQQYISASGSKIVVQSIKEANGAELFKILPINGTALQEKEVCIRDKIVLQHASSQKLLAVNVKPLLQTKHLSQQDHFSQWFGLVLEDWKDAVPTTCQYELLKAEEDAVIDIYYVIGLSSCLCSHLKKVSMLIPEDKMDQIRTSSLFQDVISQMTGLQVAFDKPSEPHKKRLANMLRSLQTVDAMIALLMKMAEGISSPLKLNEACINICSALEKYVENGNFKSRHYLAKEQLLGSLMSMVGRGIGTEKILIALLKDDAKMGELMQQFIIMQQSLVSFIEALDTENSELMTTLAFCGKRFNNEIQDKIYERTLATGTVHNFQVNTDVQTILNGVKTVRSYLEKFGIDIDRKSSTYKYRQLSLKLEGNTGITFDEEHMSLMLSMKECMHRYLSTNEMHVLYTGEEYKGRNSILAQVLGVLVFLIGYGVYNTHNDVSQIIPLLIKIIDGNSDECPSEKISEQYSSDTPGNKIVFTIKSLALQCLHSLIKQHFHSSVEALLYDFKCLRGEGKEMYIPENIALEDADSAEGPTQNLQTETSIDDEQLQPKIMNLSLFKEISSNAEQIELEEIEIISKKKSEYVPVPIKMNELLKNEKKPSEKLCVTSRKRLRYNFRRQMYSVFDVDTTESKNLCSILLDLINYEDSDVCLLSADLLFQMFHVETILLTKAEDAYFTTPYTNVEIHSKMEELATMADSEQLLKQLLRNQVQNEEKLLNTLEMLSNFCVSSKDESEPNASNQGMAFSCGLFNVILEFVLEYGVSDESHCKEKILSSCFTFLQRTTRKNSRAQNKLFYSFNDFLEIRSAVVSMTFLLTEVFSNNSSLCKQLSEADIKKLFFASVSSSNPEHYELTVTLQTIIQNTEPASPLQEYVSQLFLDHWQDNLGHLLGQENQSKRLNILEKDGNNDPCLQLLLNISDLLASCAVGKCHFAEFVCHQFYDKDELLLILVNEKIMSYRKLPFVRLLTWTFLNTERDSTLPCSQLASSRNFWLHMEEQISLFDETMFKEISSLTIKQKKNLQIKLKSLTKANWSINQWMKYSASVASLSGNLLYVIEGLLPMLSGFCYEMSLHLSGKNELCTGILKPREVNIVKEISEKLLKLLRFEMICASGHVKSLKQCINNVTQFCETLHEPCSFDQLVLSSLNRSRAGSSIPSSSVPEVTLNQDLQAYVKKYSQAYDKSSSEMQQSLNIPNDPSFFKLMEFFTDDDDHIRSKADSSKVKKLTLILRNLIQKQKKQSLHTVERARLEGVTLITLKLLCGVIFKRIERVSRSSLKLEEFQQKYEKVIQPTQTVLINEKIVETLIDLLHHPKDDIAFQVLACLSVLLYPGNEEALKRITSRVNQQDRSLFIRVHQILRGAQFTPKKAKIGNAMAGPQVSSVLQKYVRTELIDHRIAVALKVLSRLCDGQQKGMQDILRDEKAFSGSNIVSQVAFLLQGITEHLSKSESNINVAQGAVQALIEMCAGNYSNQVIAFKGQVIFSIETVLMEKDSAAMESLRKLKSLSIELLEVLLEETDEKSQILAQWIMNQWNLEKFLGAMFGLWQAYSGTSNQEQLRNSVFRAYHVLMRIADYEGTNVDKLVDYEKHSRQNSTTFDGLFGKDVDEAKRMWQHCQKWSRSIEVVYKAKSGKEILTRTYFPYDPHKHLNENEKNTILLRIKRNTPQEKLFDLLQWTKAIRSAHEWKKKLKRSWKTKWLLWASTMRHLFLFWLTILINAIVLFVVRVPSDYDNGVCTVDGTCNSTSPQYFRPIWQPDAPSWYYLVLYTLGGIHLILAMWMTLLYYAKNWSNLRFEVLILKRILYNAKKGLLRRRHIYNFLMQLNKVFCCEKFHAKRPQPEKYFQIFFFSFEPLYRIFFAIFSLLGLISSGYFYCGCMIYLFLRNNVLLNVLRAVRKSALQLITIFILGLVVFYIYAVISFVLIPNYFSEMEDQFCRTLLQCFVTITRLGLLNTLGSAIAIRPSTEHYQPNFTVVGWRLLYDIVFFIVVTTLGLNIVIAILVDRFSDLREEKDKLEEDNNSRCFVCSIKKDVFERNGLNFREHSQIQHNMWNYIHFVLYLDTVHPNDHNALEKYVSQRIHSKANDAGMIDFFPLFKAKALPADYVIGEGDT